MYDEDDLESIHESRDEWKGSNLDQYLEYGERKERFATVSNHEVERLYTPADVADIDYEADLGFPGEPPYTRGPYPTTYRGRT